MISIPPRAASGRGCSSGQHRPATHHHRQRSRAYRRWRSPLVSLRMFNPTQRAWQAAGGRQRGRGAPGLGRCLNPPPVLSTAPGPVGPAVVPGGLHQHRRTWSLPVLVHRGPAPVWVPGGILAWEQPQICADARAVKAVPVADLETTARTRQRRDAPDRPAVDQRAELAVSGQRRWISSSRRATPGPRVASTTAS